MESMLGRFWLFADTRINLIPLDESEPRLGGRVLATQTTVDFSTLTLQNKHYHGVYGEDFLTYGEFAEDQNPEDEATLLKIFDDADQSAVVDRHTFKFDETKVSYSRRVNSEVKDAETEHQIDETPLSQSVGNTWSEVLFYGQGNAKM